MKFLEERDIPQVVKIHTEELPGFLTELGSGFLKKYYIESLKVPELFTILMNNKSGIAGFATGVTSASGLNKKIVMKNPSGFGYEILKYLFTHIRNLPKMIKTLTYPGFEEDIPELLTIAISKKHQKKGIGRILFSEITGELKKRGKNKFLVSVYDRLPANGFYLKMGCRLHSSFDFLGEKMNYYEYKII